jgi:aspartyl/asparaginyl-tRNA synthetase
MKEIILYTLHSDFSSGLEELDDPIMDIYDVHLRPFYTKLKELDDLDSEIYDLLMEGEGMYL